MKFRQELLKVYRASLNKEKNRPFQGFVRDKVCNILRNQFLDERLKNFYLLSQKELDTVQEGLNYAAGFDFRTFIDFGERQINFMLTRVEGVLPIIQKDSDFDVSIEELNIGLDEIKEQLSKKSIDKSYFNQYFKKLHSVTQLFIKKQREFEILIDEEFIKNKRKKEVIIELPDSLKIECDNCILLFCDNRGIADYSISQAKNLIVQIYTVLTRRKLYKTSQFQKIQELIDNGRYIESIEMFIIFCRGMDVTIDKEIINQLRKLSDIILKYSKNEDIPTNVIEIFKINLESFNKNIESFLADQNIYDIKFGYGYIMREGFTELQEDIKNALSINKCFEQLNLKDSSQRKNIIARLLEKNMISKRVDSWFTKNNYDINNEYLIINGKEILNKLQDDDEKQREIEEKNIRVERRKKDYLNTILDLIKNKKEGSKGIIKKVFTVILAIFTIIIASFHALVKYLLLIPGIIAGLFNKFINYGSEKKVPGWLNKILPNGIGGRSGSLHNGGEGKCTFGDLFDDIIDKIIKFGDKANSFNSKSHNVANQLNLRSYSKDKITGFNIINYDRLINKLLIGEIFTDFRDYKWKKEKIDFTDYHIIEEYDKIDNVAKEKDYSIFLDRFKWKIKAKENDPVILVLEKKGLKKGRNAIVCPRGYIPIITEGSKNKLIEQKISYKLFCIKGNGYYYIDLSEKPNFDIHIEFRRYGDNDCMGIYFAHDDIRTNDKLTEKILNESELSKEVGEIYKSVIDSGEKEYINTLCAFFKNYFKYSCSKETTREHKTHKTHLSGVCISKKGDCKNVNSLLIGLARLKQIKSRLLGGYVGDVFNNYTGHAVVEVNDGGKCWLIDSTPKMHHEKVEKEEKNKAEKVKEIFENTKGKIAKYSLFVKKILDKINIQRAINKIEEKWSRLLARKVINKKRQIESTIFIKYWNSKGFKIIGYDLMLLPDPISAHNNLNGRDYITFLKKYYEILSSIENQIISGNEHKGIDQIADNLKIRKWRINSLKRMSKLIGKSISYEEFINEYYNIFGKKTENGEKINSEGNKEIMFIQIIESVLIKKGVLNEEMPKYINSIKKYFGEWLPELCKNLIDIEGLDNSNHIEYVYLPSNGYNEKDASKAHALLNSDALIKQIKAKKMLFNSLDIIYETLNNNGAFNEKSQISKKNFMHLLGQVIEDIKVYEYINVDDCESIANIIKRGIFENDSISEMEYSILPIRRLSILLIINSLLSKNSFLLSIDDNIKNIAIQKNDFNEYILSTVNRLPHFNKYVEKIGSDDFIKKVYLLLSYGIKSEKYDYYLSQESFVKNPDNLIFIIRIITREIQILKDKIKIEDRPRTGTGLYNSPSHRDELYFNHKSNRDEINNVIIIMEKLTKLRNEIKNNLIEKFGLNTSIITELIGSIGIESNQDMEIINKCIQDIMFSNSDEKKKEYEPIMDVLFDYYLENNKTSFKTVYGGYGGYGNNFWEDANGGTNQTKLNIEQTLLQIPGETIIEIVDKLLKKEKRKIKEKRKELNKKNINQVVQPEHTIVRQDNYKKIEKYILMVKILKQANYNNLAHRMLSITLIDSIQRMVYSLEAMQYSQGRGYGDGYGGSNY